MKRNELKEVTLIVLGSSLIYAPIIAYVIGVLNADLTLIGFTQAAAVTTCYSWLVGVVVKRFGCKL